MSKLQGIERLDSLFVISKGFRGRVVQVWTFKIFRLWINCLIDGLLVMYVLPLLINN